ncbi:MAG TPA: VOC family protein [Candidatus Dormibacteraeota bacterium]
MTEATSHAPGIPTWADVASPDIEASKAFYTALFGWEAQTAEAPEAGGYTMFSKNGSWVAGLGPSGDRQPSWMTYVSTDDLDATTERVRAAGGTVMVEPMQVMTAGRMAVYQDPTGAAFSAWEPGDHIGAQLVNEPGTICWTELQTRDPEAAKAFYEAVFGWGSETATGPIPYTEWKQDGRSIGGMMPMGDQFPAEVPSHWVVYLGAGDVDADTARAVELGGRVVVPPMDIQEGLRFSWVTDPQGAPLGLVRMTG